MSVETSSNIPSVYITLENVGPFEHANLDIRPLTLLIGRNASGKSLLMRLLWIISATSPNFGRLLRTGLQFVQQESRCLSKIVREGTLEGVHEEDVKQEFREMLCKILKEFWNAYEDSLNLVLESPLTLIGSILKEGSRIRVAVKEPVEAHCEITFLHEPATGGPRAKVETHPEANELAEKLADTINIDVEFYKSEKGNAIIRIRIDGASHPIDLSESLDSRARNLWEALLRALAYSIGETFRGFFASHPRISVYLSESRGVVARSHIVPTLLEDYALVHLYLEVLRGYAYKDPSYLSTRIRETPWLSKLLEELGCREIITKGVAFLPGIPYTTFYVKTWDSVEIPILQAPSGLRQIIPVLLLVLGEFHECPLVLLLEEPEVHMHPRALKYLSRFLAYVVNNLPILTIVISTHSDMLVSYISELIAASGIPEYMLRSNKEVIEKLEITEDCVLDPDMVSVYLLDRPNEGRYVEVKPIPVDKGGIDMEHFREIVDELSHELDYIEMLRRIGAQLEQA